MAGIFSNLSGLLTRREPAFQSWSRPAAVMVLLAEKPVPSVLLIRRPETLTYHAGQIACPGGSFESSLDGTLWDTACRETQEEVGIVVSRAAFLGFLDPVHIPVTGFTFIPAVSYLAQQVPVTPDAAEVHSYCWVPWEELKRVKRMGSLTVRGVPRPFPEFPLPWGRVWGATARVLDQLSTVLTGAEEGVISENSKATPT